MSEQAQPTTPPVPDAERRRLWSAGRALCVLVLALLLSLLLNAPGVHKRAYNQPQGWKRTTALALTGPLKSLSDALWLDEPRKGVQSLAGRSGEDTINVNLGIIRTATPRTAAVPPPTVRRAFTPKDKLKLMIVGDSLVIVPGNSIVRAALKSPVITDVGGVDGRISTGLTRPDVFNWFDAIRDRVRELEPGVVILDFGGNDDKSYMTGLPDGVSIGQFGDEAWRNEYRRRVGAIFDIVARAGAHAIWIGLPQTHDVDQTRRFDVINAVVAQEALRRPGSATYIDTYRLFAGDDAGYAQYLTTARGKTVKVRADDGVHFEPAGGDIIAREVLKTLNQVYDLTSWRTKSS
jgi:uncharacterized protein